MKNLIMSLLPNLEPFLLSANVLNLENLNFRLFKLGDKILNYILYNKYREYYIIKIYSTYIKKNLDYNAIIITSDPNIYPKLLNIIKQYTWTIDGSKNIKTYDKKYLHLRPLLHKEFPDSTFYISVVETTEVEKSYLHNLIKNNKYL